MPTWPITSFAPDTDPTQEGTIRDCDKILPTKQGIQAMPGPADVDNTGSASESVTNAITITKTDGSIRTFIGQAADLKESVSTDWVFRSKTTAGYGGSTTTRWRFTQFNDRTLATNRADPVQSSDTDVFADLTGSLQASIITTVGNFNLGSFLFAFDTNDATNGSQGDRWKCSAVGDPTDFVASIATLAATGRLTSAPGKITAAHPLGDDVIVYKERGIYIGRFVGPPIIWEFKLISESLGTPTHEAVINIEDRHLVMGADNFYEVLPGGYIRIIENDLKRFFFDESLSLADRGRTVGVHDSRFRRVIWSYISSAGGALDKYLAFHYDSSPPRWTRGDLAVETIWQLISSTGTTYDELGTLFTTYNDITSSNFSYDVAFGAAQAKRSVAYIEPTTHIIREVSSAGLATQIIFWDMRIDGHHTFMDDLRPHFIKAPEDGTVWHSSKEEIGDTFLSSDITSALTTAKRFDIMHSAPIHRLRMTTTGTMELSALSLDWRLDGES